MKKAIKITLIFMLVLVTMLCTKVFATDESLTIDIEVATPEEGVYGVGQEVTIKVTFNKPIKGTMPKYAIYFGDDSSNLIEVSPEEITDFTTEVLYKYTIKSGDNGEMKPEGFVNSSEYTIEDESGQQYYVTSSFGLRFEKAILADTTIEWADFANATVEMKTDDAGYNTFFDLLLSNCTLKSDNYYYVHLSHDENEEIVVKNIDDLYDNTEFWQTTINTTNNKMNLSSEERDIFAQTGDVYATVCEIDNETDVPKIVLKSKKITRLPQLPLTQRITSSFFDDRTSTLCWEIYSENQQNLSYKIGKVTDLNLLKSLKNGDASALSDLLTYAKNAQVAWTGTIKLGQDTTITDKLDLVDDEYYYVYLQLDTVNGKYVQIEDVSLYQALVVDDGDKNLFPMSDKDFEWNLEEQEEQFTDFSNAKAIISSVKVTDNEADYRFAVYNINIDTQKKHKFYFYISNNTQDIPEYDSELWNEVDTFEKNEELDTYIIETTNIMNLSYIDNIDFEKEVYISIYEVISDEEITTNQIEGTYKLVLTAEKVDLELEGIEDGEEPENNNSTPETNDKKEDNTTAKGEIPKAGLEKTIILFVMIVAIALIILSKKCKKYRDII